MRYAALAFGIVAGLVASLVLALGGLDLDLLAIDQRQLAGVRFGLFVIANLGVFGAGLVLGAPLAGVALFILGALAWVGAAVMLHHGPDLVMLVPPALLLVAAGVSFASWFFARRAAQALPPMSRSAGFNQQRDAYSDNRGDEVEDESDAREPALAADAYDEMPRISVGAGFFGEGGTAMPLRAETVDARNAPAVDDDDDEPPARRTADWRPGRKRPPPPRTASVFREIESDEDADDESTFARLARVIGGLLSFGLYAALAGAAILIFFNLQSRDVGQPTATKVEAVSSEPSAQPAANRASSSASAPKPETSALPAMTAAASAPASLPPVSSAEDSPNASAPVVLRGLPGVVTVGTPTGTEASDADPPQSAPAADSPEATASSTPAIEVVPPANTLSDPNIVVPWPVPAILAAQRAKPSPRPPQQTTAPTAPRVDTTGL